MQETLIDVKKNSCLWQSIGWKLLSCAAFAGINVIVRLLKQQEVPLSGTTIAFYQNLLGVIFLLPMILKMGIDRLNTKYPILHLLRVTAAVLGVALWYEAVQNLTIPQAVSLNFTGPIFTVITAWFFLGERLNWGKLGAILFSTFGALLIARPDLFMNAQGLEDIDQMVQSVPSWIVLLPMASALAIALSKMLTRRLALLGEAPDALAIYLMVFMTPISCIVAILSHKGLQFPQLAHWPWLLMVGGLAALAHWSFAKAYQLAEVTFLMPIGVFKFLLNIFLSYLIFSEYVGTGPVYFGMCFIFAGAAMLTWHAKRTAGLLQAK